MRIIYSIVLTLSLLSSSLSQTPRDEGYKAPTDRGDGWRTATADSAGVDSQKLLNLTRSLRAWPELGVHAVLIERNSQLIYEEYFNGFDERWGLPLGPVTITAETKHDLRSVTKSVVSALVGIAQGEGAIKSRDDPVAGR
ncbi:MAG TPA: hypothetical protein VFS77_21315 [Pyrinomonadaceae bacterium]|nr:hypothetical protein [Pyrinomonadaceae bacterium]